MVNMSPDSRSASNTVVRYVCFSYSLEHSGPRGGSGEGSLSSSTVLLPKPEGPPPYSWDRLRADLRLSFKLSCTGKDKRRPVRRLQGDANNAVVGVAACCFSLFLLCTEAVAAHLSGHPPVYPGHPPVYCSSCREAFDADADVSVLHSQLDTGGN